MVEERVSIFIDGSNLYHNLKRYNIKVTFEEIIKKFEVIGEITNIFYYTALLDRSFDEKRYLEHKKFLDKISKIPNFHIILCNLRKVLMPDGSVNYAIKGDDVHLATDLISGSYENLYDVAIIVSGDADFISAIKVVQKNAKKVVNAFFPKSSSYLLRNCCNNSINLRRLLQK
ncbi:NYN domain-containing protein [Candidatus Pacearchaeota archaeon]|nr:NYN domain-containing protein [Candidatus Pacearchaeota archaeon]